MKEVKKLLGFGIAILDRGWVYVGNIEIDEEYCIIIDAKNIRQWGTTKGLGELAKKGPLINTKLDDYGKIIIPKHSLNHIIESDRNLWEK